MLQGFHGLTRRWYRVAATACALAFAAPLPALADGAPSGLRVATFVSDATPPLKYPLSGDAPSTLGIRDPLSARGIVILGAGSPIVIASLDWLGIDEGTRDLFHATLAKAAGTTPDRVTVHVLHQHEAPTVRLGEFDELTKRGLPITWPAGVPDAKTWVTGVMNASASALRASLADARPFTHVGTSSAPVERIASNRVVIMKDGKVMTRLAAYKYTPHVLVRLKKLADANNYRVSPFHVAEARSAAEGVIDNEVRVMSLWDGDKPLVALNYYATHPQVTVGTGIVTAEFVGLARDRRQRETGVFQLYMQGAAGDITPGKYSDGSDQARIEMTDRLADAMRRAWTATTRKPVGVADVEWRTTVAYMPSKFAETAEELRLIADDQTKPVEERVRATSQLYKVNAINNGARLAALKLGDTYSLFMKGEMFIEYQLAAQKMRPNDFVGFVGYGGGYGYIGTSDVYALGGYEAAVSWTTKGAEPVFIDAMKRLLY